MSRADVDDATLAEIAQVCGVPQDSIEDVYRCTPIQQAMIKPARSEVFHIVMSFGPAADVERFCDALEHVVSLNSVLRTRIVECCAGMVQVVTSQKHVTQRRLGDVDQFMSEGHAPRLGLGLPLFNTMFVGRGLIVSIHHAIMDHWSMTAFLRQDVASAYYGYPPPLRTEFKRFVEHCVALDEASARRFWRPRFKGVPGIFPQSKRGYSPHASQKQPLKITLDRIGNDVPKAHLPYYCEAAWAITSSIYADSTAVAYGYVLSGRSAALAGASAEDTLGLTITEVPIQVNLQTNMTVEALIKDRAASLRQLQASSALQYGMDRIGTVSEAAGIASGCQTLFNIRPLTNSPFSPEKLREDDISFRHMEWLGGSFPLQLVFNIHEDGVLVEPRSDEQVIPDVQLRRVLHQYAHILRLLTKVPPSTKMDGLPLLSAEDHDEIFRWYGKANEKNGSATLGRGLDLGVDKATVWIVEPRAPFDLAPIGAVGELLIQTLAVTSGPADNGTSATADEIRAPHWWISSPRAAGTTTARQTARFLRTGDLAKYSPDGIITLVGRLENRVRLRGQSVQLEDIERVLLECDLVRDIVTLVKIAQGRTQLVALVSLAEPHERTSVVCRNEMEDGGGACSGIEAISDFAKIKLSADRVPTVWYVVGQVPRTAQGLDRAAARQWAKTLHPRLILN